MAVVSLQVSPSSELRWGSSPGYYTGGRLDHGDRQVNSVPVSSSGVGAGGRGVNRSLLVCEDSVLIGSSKGRGRSLGKSPNRVKGNYPGWWEGRRNWSNSSREKRGIRCGETARDTSRDKFSRGDGSKDFFVDQGYEYESGKDFFSEDRATDGVRGVNGRVRSLIPDEEDLDKRSYIQEEAKLRWRSAQNRVWVQLDEGKERREAYRSGGNGGAGNLIQEDEVYAWEAVSATAGNDEALGKPTQVGFYEETLDEDRPVVRGPFIEWERDGENYQSGRASDDSMFLGQVQESARDNEAIPESLGPSGRDRTGYQRQSGFRRNLREKSAHDEDKLGRRRLVPETERQNRSGEYMGRAEETTENLPFRRDAQEGNLDASRGEERWQSSSRRQVESYPSNPVVDGRSGVKGTDKSASVLRKGPNDDNMSSRRGSPAKVWALETANRKWSQVLARGDLYAKQVISQATAQSIGVITQLWVDMESLKVVALEVRPNLLFGNFDSILLNNLSKVGDVILIHDQDAILDDLNLFNCSDLVGIDLFTENGFCLGKVRDYDFSLEDGAVLSLDFDTFGVPLIPSTVISTYSLTADEVIEAQEDSLLVREGAEKRVRKLTKGLFSRPKQASRRRQSPPKEWRSPPLISARSSAATTGRERYMESSMGQERELVGTILQKDEDSAKFSPPGEQLKRGSIYSQERRAVLDDSSLANNFEVDQGQEVYPKDSFSSRKKYFPPEMLEDDQALPPIRKEVYVRDAPQISGSRQTRANGARKSTPEVSINARGLPISYRTSKQRVENDV